MARISSPVVMLLVLVAGLNATRAEPNGSPSPAQPAVSLPRTDILNPDVAGEQQAGGVKAAASLEESREIRPSSEPGGGGVDRKPSSHSALGAEEAGRLVNRQSGGKGLWRTRDFLPLAIVLALVLAAAWLVKRYLPARRLVTGSGVLEIVARLPLAPKQSLVLVKMGRRMILVGVSPERVNTVCLVDDPEQVTELIGRIASQSRDSSARAFGQSLDRQADAFDEQAGGFGERGDAEPLLESAGGVRGLLEKVRRLSKSEVPAG